MIRGSIIIVVGIVLLSVGMNVASNWINSSSPPPNTKFEVVDNYKGCDVVRWTQSNFAEYKYFLHCAS
jgi:hypothetical protein